MASRPHPPLMSAKDIIPSSMCLSMLVRDGLGIPTVKANHQPAAVKIALPRRLERLAFVSLTQLGLPSGIFLDQSRLAPYTAASGGLMPLNTPREQSNLTPMSPGSAAEQTFLSELSELLSRQYALSMGSASYLGQGLTVSPVINTFSGNLFVCSLDASALWKGLNVMLYRIFNGLSRPPGPFGPGWSHNFAARLDFQEEGAIQYTRWDGSHYCYKPREGGWKSPEGFDDELTRSGTGYLMKDVTGFYLFFDATGKVAEVGNRLGFRLRFEYNGEKLASIRNMGTVIQISAQGQNAELTQGGPGIHFEYDEHDRITAVRSTSGASVGYQYDEVGRLAKVTSNSQQSVLYRYDQQGRLAEIRDGTGSERGTVIAGIYYDEVDRVKEITDAAGTSLMRMNYRWGIDRTTQIQLGAQKQLVTDRYDDRGVLIERMSVDQSLDPTQQATGGTQRQSRECDEALNVVSLTREGGDISRWSYDSAGNLTRASDSNGTWVDIRYRSDMPLIEYISESHGRHIQFIYAADNTIQEIVLDDGNHYKLDYDEGGVPRDLISPNGGTKPLDLGLPPEIPKQLWEF